MKQEALKYFTDIHLTSLGLLIFFCFFIAVIFWCFRKGSAHFYNQIEKMPLLDDTGENYESRSRQ